MKYSILPPKVKFTLNAAPTTKEATIIRKGYYSKVVDGKIVGVADPLNNDYGIDIPTGATTFVYKGSIQALGGGQVGPSVTFLDATGNVLDTFWATDQSIVEKSFDIPAGTVRIWAPCIVYGTPVFAFAFNETDVTDSVINLEDIETLVDREATTGVLPSIVYRVQFGVNTLGYNILKEQFDTYGVRAAMSMNVYDKAYHDETYRKLTSNPLNFFEYQEYEDAIEISAIASTIAEILKSGATTNFDIPVADLEPENWQYEDIALNQFAKYEIAAEVELTIPAGQNIATVAMSEPTGDNNIYLIPGAMENDIKGQSFKVNPGVSEYFFEAADNVLVTYQANMQAEFVIVSPKQYIYNNIVYTVNPSGFSADIGIMQSNGTEVKAEGSLYDFKTVGDNYEVYIRVNFNANTSAPLNLHKGDRLQLFVRSNYKNAFYTFWSATRFQFQPDAMFQIVFPSQFASSSMRPIQVIDPEKLLQKFLDLMSGEPGMYTAYIQWDLNDAQKFKYRIVAAESIAGYEKPYFHGKMDDFIKFMRVIGYEYQFQPDSLRMAYVKRDALFQKGEILDLSESEVSDLSRMPATQLIYSQINAGCEKQDYDNEYLNGLEINATFEYSTNIQGTENILDFVSPYRTDAVGIQNLYRSFKDTSPVERQDVNSDVFAVVLTPGGLTYKDVEIEVTDQLTGEPIQLFNALLSGPYIVKANESLIGIGTNKLFFASTDGNREGTIGGNPINADIDIAAQLFSPLIYHFSEGSHSFPDISGALTSSALIAFTWRGKKLRGFIKSISRMVGEESEREWELYAE